MKKHEEYSRKFWKCKKFIMKSILKSSQKYIIWSNMTDEGKITSALVTSILELKVLYLKSCSYVDSKSLPIDQSDIFRFFEGFGKFLQLKMLYFSWSITWYNLYQLVVKRLFIKDRSIFLRKLEAKLFCTFETMHWSRSIG